MLALRFDQHMTQQQIADQIGVSQMLVCRTLSRALNRLRELTTNDGCRAAPTGSQLIGEAPGLG